MNISCKVTSKQFTVPESDLRMLDKLSPTIGGVKCALPAPSMCPDERKRRRLAFRNERFLYHHRCDFSNEPIVSAFSPDKPYKVYSRKAWWSDSWDARAYGRDFDFSRPFFEQFAELRLEVPQLNLISSPDADENNCPYVNFAGFNKNCHMIFDSDFCEDSYYSNVLKHSKNCVDCSYVHSSELCYECVDCTNCYHLLYSRDCSGCSDSYFLHGCIGCKNCFLCTNLVQKEYWFENKPCSKEEYLAKLSALDLHSHSAVKALVRRFEEFHISHPKKFCRILKCENCLGDYLTHARNCFHCFNGGEIEDLRYCDSVYSAKDCMDVSSFGERIQCIYNSGTIGVDCFNIFMSYVIVGSCYDLLYCDNCRQSHHSFGCCSLRHNEYCILNKQYAPDDYEKLAQRIIAHMQETGEWGEFFPLSLSPYGYNETLAQEILPLSREEALRLNARWSDYQPPTPDVPVVEVSEMPETIAELDFDLTGRALRCPVSGKPYRLTKPELRYYQEQGLPIPRLHPDERHKRRMQLRNPQTLWKRPCAKTGEEIFTTYSPDRPEIVYSEKAYLETLT